MTEEEIVLIKKVKLEMFNKIYNRLWTLFRSKAKIDDTISEDLTKLMREILEEINND